MAVHPSGDCVSLAAVRKSKRINGLRLSVWRLSLRLSPKPGSGWSSRVAYPRRSSSAGVSRVHSGVSSARSHTFTGVPYPRRSPVPVAFGVALLRRCGSAIRGWFACSALRCVLRWRRRRSPVSACRFHPRVVYSYVWMLDAEWIHRLPVKGSGLHRPARLDQALLDFILPVLTVAWGDVLPVPGTRGWRVAVGAGVRGRSAEGVLGSVSQTRDTRWSCFGSSRIR